MFWFAPSLVGEVDLSRSPRRGGGTGGADFRLFAIDVGVSAEDDAPGGGSGRAAVPSLAGLDVDVVCLRGGI